MNNCAYLRISANTQGVNNQKHGILKCSNSTRFLSSAKRWRQRRLIRLLEGLSVGDTIIFAEVTCMARSTLEVLELYMEKQVSVHIAKQNMLLDGSSQDHGHYL